MSRDRWNGSIPQTFETNDNSQGKDDKDKRRQLREPIFIWQGVVYNRWVLTNNEEHVYIKT